MAASYLEHPQHALRDEESACDVDGGHQHGDRAKNGRRAETGAGHDEHAAHQDDAADGVGHARP